MGESPEFSIIVPVYNAGPYLARAVRSALRQSCEDFELILVDDGSTDTALNEIQALPDTRIRIFRQANQGAPAACNAALALSRGSFVAFLDQDDLWAPGKLACHKRWFEQNPGVDLTFTWSSYIGADDQVLGLPVRRWRGHVGFAQLLVDNVIGNTSSAAVRRAAIERAGGFDPRLRLVYDLDLYLRVARLRPRNALAIPEVLAYYRRHSRQMSRDLPGLRRDWEALLEKMRGLAPEETAQVERRAGANMSRYFAYVAYESRSFREACGLLAEGFRFHPAGFLADPRNWKLLAASCAGRWLPADLHRRLESLAGIRLD